MKPSNTPVKAFAINQPPLSNLTGLVLPSRAEEERKEGWELR